MSNRYRAVGWEGSTFIVEDTTTMRPVGLSCASRAEAEREAQAMNEQENPVDRARADECTRAFEERMAAKGVVR